MRLFLLFFCIVVFSRPATAQQHVADSLYAYIARYEKIDTHRVLQQCRLAAAQLAFDPKLSDSTARAALTVAKELYFTEGEVFALNLLGILAQRRSRYAEAINYFLPAVEKARTGKDTVRWHRSLNNLALSHFYTENYPLALSHFRQALALQKSDLDKAGIYGNMGLTYKNMGVIDSAFAYFYQAVPICIKYNNQRGLAANYSNLGNLHLQKGEAVQAEHFFRHALDADQKSGNEAGEAISRCNLGVALLRSGRPAEAKTALLEGYRMTAALDNVTNQQYAAENLSLLYEKQGRLDSALLWARRHTILRDTMNRREQRDKVADINNRFLYREELAQAEEAVAATRRQRLLWIIGTFVLSLLLALTGLAWWQTRRRRAAETRLYALERTEQLRRESVLQGALQERDTTLASHSMQLLLQKDLMGRLSGQLQEAAAGHADPGQLKALQRVLASESQNEEQWEQFKTQFEAIHSGFFQRLLFRQPKLTAFDLRYCAYLRMNLSSKEIAGLLNTSVRSVETQRYRLRKKLALSPEQDLVAWMIQV
ncbi:MAG: tetratricopeptide repeat protein [Saprospiraceae bacterium]